MNNAMLDEFWKYLESRRLTYTYSEAFKTHEVMKDYMTSTIPYNWISRMPIDNMTNVKRRRMWDADSLWTELVYDLEQADIDKGKREAHALKREPITSVEIAPGVEVTPEDVLDAFGVTDHGLRTLVQRILVQRGG